MQIAVGSKNPVKIEAVRLAFAAIWPEEEWTVEGIEVSSGVSDQPMSDAEAIEGARNRARRVLEKKNADFGVGLEGGLHQIGEQHFDCGWVVVRDTHGNEGIGSTVRVATPPRVLELIQQGMELGTVSDILFEKQNSHQSEGYFGLMTKNVITRTEGYKDGVIVALSRFIHPHLF